MFDVTFEKGGVDPQAGDGVASSQEASLRTVAKAITDVLITDKQQKVCQSGPSNDRDLRLFLLPLNIMARVTIYTEEMPDNFILVGRHFCEIR